MNPDAKLAADTLRKMANLKQMLAFPHDTGKIINACADLIESLAAELERVKRERDELASKNNKLQARNDTLIAKEVLFDEAIAAGAKMQRERDAAVEDMAGICRKHNVCDGCKNDDAAYIPNDCIDCANACNWQWCGVKEAKHEP